MAKDKAETNKEPKEKREPKFTKPVHPIIAKKRELAEAQSALEKIEKKIGDRDAAKAKVDALKVELRQLHEEELKFLFA